VGVLFALALAVLALGIMAVGGRSALLFERVRYTVVLPEASGLTLGAPVRVSGVDVGTVTEIRLPKDPARAGIQVQIGVDPDYAPRIRQDSAAGLRIYQLLTNEKFIEISPGSEGSPPVEPGAEIRVDQSIGVMQRGEAIAENLSDITVSLEDILGTLQRGEGLLGQMLKDPEFGQEGLRALGQTLAHMEQLTADLAAGRGTAGRLLRDEQLARRVDELGESLGQLSGVLAAIGRREGAVGDLLAEGGPGQQAIRDIAAAADALRAVAGRLRAPEGLLGRMLNDPEYSEALATDLRHTLGHLRSITGKIDRGEGTLGALVNDRSLHDGAEEVVAGVNDSKFARWLLRHYRKKGIRLEPAAAPPPPAAAPETPVPEAPAP